MDELTKNIIGNSGISVSRNLPLAFVVGAAGFLGSYLCEELIKKGIQVIGVDDFSSGKRGNLKDLSSEKHFHFIEQSISFQVDLNENNILNNDLPRLDYAFFVASDSKNEDTYTVGLRNFLRFCKRQRDGLEKRRKENSPAAKTKDGGMRIGSDRPRVVFVSSIELYERKINPELINLKKAEINFARYTKENNLNARVVRMVTLFGPRMSFLAHDPVVRLIQASLLDELQSEQTSLEFLSRALFVEDAVELLLKTVLSGGTAQKIYDGALLDPIKVSEIKQILIDPLWYENTRFTPTALPPWPTPNLKRTMMELAWKPRTNIVSQLRKTVVYFKENEIEIPNLESEEKYEEAYKKWSFAGFEDYVKAENLEEKIKVEEQGEEKSKEEDRNHKGRLKIRIGELNIKRRIPLFFGIFIICYALLLPILGLGFGVLSIRQNIKQSTNFLREGEFDKAVLEINSADRTISELKGVLTPVFLLKQVSFFEGGVKRLEEVISASEEGVDALEHTLVGTQALFEATRVISGEVNEDPRVLYERSQSELSTAEQKLSVAYIKLSDPQLKNSLPGVLRWRIDDLLVKLAFYQDLIEKARAGAFILPELTGLNGKREYLILLQNNLELRPGGGFIGSYGKITFEGGKIVDILVDDIYNLDGNLKERIIPPLEIQTDLGQNYWYLRDSNTEPDFPTSARQAEFFYTREGGEKVNGVIAVDLMASGRLLDAIGGVNLPEYNEKVIGDNLFERVIEHTEANFSPGSQEKKNYLTALQSQLFKKIFFVSKKDWPAIIRSVGESLEEKHILIYFADPTMFSYVSSQNWAGILPREGEKKEGEVLDLVAVSESNMGANKVNYYLKRGFDLKTEFMKDGLIKHKLVIEYANNSQSETFPGGSYKNRLKIYLPFGSKLDKASFGDADITSSAKPFSDYGRAGFSLLIEVKPKETKKLAVEYQLAQKLSFKDGIADYKLNFIKQPGTDKDPLDWEVGLAEGYKLLEGFKNKTSTDLQEDRVLHLKITQ